MTDTTPWQAPSAVAPSAPPSPYGSAAQPAGSEQPTGAPGWTPPPKPGLIPLRPLTLGTLLGATFQVLRRNPRPTFGFSLLVTGLITVVTLLVIGVVSVYLFTRLENATGADQSAIEAGAVATGVLAALGVIAMSIVGSAILQGVISLEVARGTLGEKLRLGGLWRAARGRMGALIGFAALAAAAILVSLVIVVGLITAVIAFGGVAGAVIGVLLGIVAWAGSAVLYVWLFTKLSLIPSVLMLERLPLRDAIARSWSLTRGVFWKTFGIQLLVIVVIQVVANVISIPVGIIGGLGGSLLNPNSTTDGTTVTIIVIYAVALVVGIVFAAIAAVVQSATPALIYIDIRMRKEGLDLELSRFVEARQAGDTRVQNPYLQKAGPGARVPSAETYPVSSAEAPAQTSPWQ